MALPEVDFAALALVAAGAKLLSSGTVRQILRVILRRPRENDVVIRQGDNTYTLKVEDVTPESVAKALDDFLASGHAEPEDQSEGHAGQ